MNAKLKQSSKRLLQWIATAALLGITSSAMAAGIAGTKHNLSTSGAGNKTAATDQICVFCHTPHAADVSGAVPLWNKTAPVGNTYAMYSSDSMQGTALALGSVSLACLSCHDGTQAMDSTVNAPGQGLGSTGYIGTTGQWSGANQNAGKMTGVAALGVALNNDHPIGIPYCGGGLTAALGESSVTGTCGDTDFNGIQTAQIGSSQAFWVDRGGSGRQRTDIPLYNRGGTPHVECGSCHDPHVPQESSGLVSFMRVTTSGSAICLACHNK